MEHCCKVTEQRKARRTRKRRRRKEISLTALSLKAFAYTEGGDIKHPQRFSLLRGQARVVFPEPVDGAATWQQHLPPPPPPRVRCLLSRHLPARLPFRSPAAEIPTERRENVDGPGRFAKHGGEQETCRVEVTPDRLSSLHAGAKTLGLMTRDISGQSKNVL